MATIAVAERHGIPLPALVRAMRPKQFIKNGIVFVAFVFTVRLDWRPLYPDSWIPLLVKTCIAFAAFCFVAAAEYLINDVRDLASDRLHPRKRFRPIASGLVTPRLAYAAASTLFALGALLGASLGWKFLGVLGAYAALMLPYSYLLKQIVIVDVLTIAVGFALRAMAGALAIDVRISPWLYLCTILGALFLAVNKRRYELILLRSEASDYRKILSEYSLPLVDQISTTVTACTILAYSFYTFSAENLPANHVMMATIPIVMYGIFRYLYLVYQKDEGGSPDELVVRDKPLIACMVLYMAASLTLLAIFR